MAKILEGEDDFYWDWAKHEDNIFTNRGSFFLIGESMLLAANAALLAVKNADLNKYLLVFTFAGLLVTIVWLWINRVHVFITQRCIKRELKNCEPRWVKIVKQRQGYISNHIMMGIILPCGLLLVWIALIVLGLS